MSINTKWSIFFALYLAAIFFMYSVGYLGLLSALAGSFVGIVYLVISITDKE